MPCVRHRAHIVDAVLDGSGHKRTVWVVTVRQVSFSGGDVKIQFDAGEKRIKLAGKPEV